MSLKWSIPSLMVSRTAIHIEVKLVGADDATPDVTNISSDFIVLAKFTAVATGTMTQFRIRMKGSGNVQVGIYSDNAGAADALLNSVGSTAVVSGVNIITFPSTSIISGTDYWLAYNCDTSDTIGVIANGLGMTEYKALTYGTAFPNPAGAGYTTDSWTNLEAGWG